MLDIARDSSSNPQRTYQFLSAGTVLIPNTITSGEREMNLLMKTVGLSVVCFVFSPQQQSSRVSPPTVVPGAELTVVYSSDQYFEGPSWDPAGQKLYFTAFAKENEQILRLDAPGKASVWLDHTKAMNGTYLS